MAALRDHHPSSSGIYPFFVNSSEATDTLSEVPRKKSQAVSFGPAFPAPTSRGSNLRRSPEAPSIRQVFRSPATLPRPFHSRRSLPRQTSRVVLRRPPLWPYSPHKWTPRHGEGQFQRSQILMKPNTSWQNR